jgi:hypothetical protein
MPRKKKLVEWKDRKGKALLIADIRCGTIPEDMNWKVAFRLRAAFAVGDTPDEAERLFQDRLRRARKENKEQSTRAASELALLQQDRLVRPIPATNHRGEPRCEGSAAQSLLKEDIAALKHVGLSPQQFYQSRPEYYTHYPLYVIKGHVEQEIRLQKFLLRTAQNCKSNRLECTLYTLETVLLDCCSILEPSSRVDSV